MRLHGENITLIPLAISELVALAKNSKYLANSNLKELEIKEDEKKSIQERIALIENDNVYSFMWNTYWLMVEKNTHLGVGLIGFKGIRENQKNKELYAEISCGVSAKFMNKGYASEALKMMCDWSEEQNLIEYVFAQTDIHNCASQRVLRKGSFGILCNNHNTLDYKRNLECK